MNFRRIAINLASLASGGLLAQVCLITIEALIARRYGESGLGAYSTAYALALPLLVATDVGMSWKLIQDGSRDRGAIATLFGTIVVLKVLLICIAFPLSIGLISLIGYGPEIVSLFVILFWFSAFATLQENLAAIYIAQQRMYISALFQGVTYLVILIIVLMSTATSSSLTSVAWSYVAGAGLVTWIWLVLAYRTEKPRVALRRSGQILRGSYLYGITGFLTSVSIRIDVLMLALWRGLSEVGLFAACDKLVLFGLKIGVMLCRVLAPVLFEQSHQDPVAYRKTCKVVLRTFSATCGLACLGVALVADWLLIMIFGAPFGAAAIVLTLLTASLFIRLVSTVIQLILSASGEHARRTGAIGAGLATGVAANILLIPAYGIVGASCARFLGDMVQLGSVLSARSFPVPKFVAVMSVLGPLAAGIIVFVFAMLTFAHPVHRLVVALIAYVALLFLTRLITIAEVAKLIDAVRHRSAAKSQA